ncbi:YciI family protein [Maribacter sp. 2304DJ31-5]|uniref:YciI family protein n=1 Tax=Maribacter sp. 2304DJ31-5 TaxID=3386273 RepID=UPI0039BC2E92
MQEFMIFIKTKGDHLAELSPEQQQAHVQKIGRYIGGLMESGKLKGAQPLEMDGAVIHGNKGNFKDGPFNESKEVIVGYFHILAENLEEAITIAKANPMFESQEATIEIRPIKQMDGIN